MSWPALDESFLAASAATFQFRLGVPVPLAVAPDGAVLFRRTPSRAFTADLFEIDPKTGQIRVLVDALALLAGADEALSDAEKARRERSRTATRGVVDIALTPDGTQILVPLSGRLFVVHRPTLAARELPIGAGGLFDPRLSPDGRKVAFVRDGDLWVVDLDGASPPRRLTTRPGPTIEHGTAEFVAMEELARARGYWWSPDSTSILFQRTDVSPVDTLYVADARHPDRPPVPFRYPRAGTTNAVVDLGIVAVHGGAEPRWFTWDIARWPYLADVQWTRRGRLSVQVLDRDQTETALLALDPVSGAIEPLLVERDDAWINLAHGAPAWLPDGTGFVWMTEQHGAWSLELHAPDGAWVRQLIPPHFGLRSFCGFARNGRELLVTGAVDPREQHVWRLDLAGGAPQRLTDGGGVHTVWSDRDTYLLTSARRDGGTLIQAIRGTFEVDLPTVAERPPVVPTTQLDHVIVEDRVHYVAITRPSGAVPGRRYPVLLKVYAGPHVQTVVDARDTYTVDQWYADAGFIVVRIDGRGTPSRGRTWERAVLGDLGTLPLADQTDALLALGAKHPELDLDRVGVFGWSFGGYMAAMAVLRRPDVYKAAVAGAPVTDWALYDTAYTERYMKTPAANAEGYARASALTYADGLSRPLLLLHGITDDNVHFAHALALIEALYLAGRRAEVVTLSATHMVPDPRLASARERAHVDFFRAHLRAQLGAPGEDR